MNLLLAFLLFFQTADPADAQGWFRLGIARHDQGDYAGALAAFEKARELKFAAPVLLPLRIARAQARLGRKEEAFASLKDAVANGYNRPDAMNGEDDFLPLRGDPRWKELVGTAQKNQRPCLAGDFRQFDYWLGEWDVLNPQGQKIATSSIQLVLDECVIYENYSAAGYSGKSFSVWDATEKQWEQRYVDTTGASNDWTGKLEGEVMTFYQRKPQLLRMTYTKEGPDKVRQKIDLSLDEGKTWSTNYDGLYVRRK